MRGAQNYVRRYYYRDLMSGASQLLATRGRIVLGAMAWTLSPPLNLGELRFRFVCLNVDGHSVCLLWADRPKGR